jgi:hypothetical protein
VGRQLDAAARATRVVRTEEHAGGLLRHVPQRLVHGGQRRARPLGQRHVVVADDREVLGHPQAADARRLQHAERLEVAAREDGRRPAGAREQVHAVLEAAAHVVAAVADQGRVDRQARHGHRRAVPVEPGQRAQHVLEPRDDRDASVPVAGEVTGGRQTPGPVGGADGRDVGVGVAGRVDDDEGDAPRPQPLLDFRGQRGEDQDDAQRAAPEHALDPVRGGGVPGAAAGEHDLGAVGPGGVLHTPDEFHRPDAVQLVEDEFDQR